MATSEPTCDSCDETLDWRKECDGKLAVTRADGKTVCYRCDNYDGPSDDELSEFYGGGGVRPIEEQYREAIEQKRRLG